MSNLYGAIKPILPLINNHWKNIIFFDPTNVYDRIKIDPFKRRQSIGLECLFPNIVTGECACGCGEKLTGRKRRWANEEHRKDLLWIMWIINGDSQAIRQVMETYLPLECAICKKADYLIETYGINPRGGQYIKYSASGIHVDHIVSVKNGGGGCWLGNYQFLCHSCNIQKEQTDKLLRVKQPSMPISTLF